MNKALLLLSIFIFSVSPEVNSQLATGDNQESKFIIPNYLKGDYIKILYSNVSYPDEALQRRMSGDVITSFVISEKGKMDSISVLKSSDFYFSNSALSAISYITDGWAPAKLNGNPVNKRYKIIFRYRLYFDTTPPEYRKQSREWFEKKDYKRTLSFCNKTLKDDQYDYETYELRSQVKEILGDSEGSMKDKEASAKLKDEILSVITITMIGKTRSVQISSEMIRL